MVKKLFPALLFALGPVRSELTYISGKLADRAMVCDYASTSTFYPHLTGQTFSSDGMITTLSLPLDWGLKAFPTVPALHNPFPSASVICVVNSILRILRVVH